MPVQVETELEFENKKKPSVLFCEHFRLFREKETKENNLVWLSCVIFEFLHSVGLVGKRVDLWEFNHHPRLQPLHDMIEIRRYIPAVAKERKNLHDPEIVPSVSLFNDSEGIGFFSPSLLSYFPSTTRIFPTFSRKNKITSLNWVPKFVCISNNYSRCTTKMQTKIIWIINSTRFFAFSIWRKCQKSDTLLTIRLTW